MSKSNPTVSVVMPMYNGERYVQEAIESILGQSFHDLELIIIDDGSTDGGPAIVRSYKDDRINLVHNPTNLGVVATRNRALELAKGRYIAVMDCDDISMRQRLEKQVAFMDKNPKVGISGAWAKTLGSRVDYVLNFDAADKQLKADLIFFNPMVHSTVIMNRGLINSTPIRYSEDFSVCEDYDFIARGSRHFELANIPEVLLRYRTHAVSLIHEAVEKVHEGDHKIRISFLEEFNLPNGWKNTATHESHTYASELEQREEIPLIENWLTSILEANQRQNLYDQAALSLSVYRHWLKTCNTNANLGLWMWKAFRGSKLCIPQGDRTERKRLAKCFLQCMAKRHVAFS